MIGPLLQRVRRSAAFVVLTAYALGVALAALLMLILGAL